MVDSQSIDPDSNSGTSTYEISKKQRCEYRIDRVGSESRFMRGFAIIVSLILLVGCMGEENPPPVDEESYTPFHSGFETGVSVTEFSDRFGDIIGSDGMDWESDLEDNGSFGNFRIFYEGGDDSQRSASIIEIDGDRVLEFRLSEANVNEGEKGRVSASLTNNHNLTEFAYSVNVNLTDAFDLIEPAEGRLTWMTIAEFWNDNAQTEYAFRITLAIHKEDAAPNTPLSWALAGQTQNTTSLMWDDVWTAASEVPVPIDTWFTLQIAVIEGDGDSGQVFVKMGANVLFDIVDWTYHPDKPIADGFENLNPMKLYTAGDVLEMLPEGRAFVILWDDFTISQNAG